METSYGARVALVVVARAVFNALRANACLDPFARVPFSASRVLINALFSRVLFTRDLANREVFDVNRAYVNVRRVVVTG